MKRSLSSIFVPIDLHKILKCVAPALIKDDFENNSLNKEELYHFYIYPDPTLKDGECEYMGENDVFLCSKQYESISQLIDLVMIKRIRQLGPIEFDFKNAKGRCTFAFGMMGHIDDWYAWTFELLNWDFDRACYFGPDVIICPYAQDLPKDQLQWKGEAGMCKAKHCKEEDYEQRIFCETHDVEHKEIHKK